MNKPAHLIIGFFIAAATVITSTGCATLADAQGEKGAGGAGTIKTYKAEFDEVWDAVVRIIQGSVLEIVVNNKQKGELLAQRSMTLFSYGENVAIYIEKVGSTGSMTKIEVISKRALATNITAKNWESHIVKKLDALFLPGETQDTSGNPGDSGSLYPLAAGNLPWRTGRAACCYGRGWIGSISVQQPGKTPKLFQLAEGIWLGKEMIF